MNSLKGLDTGAPPDVYESMSFNLRPVTVTPDVNAVVLNQSCILTNLCVV